MLHIDLLGFALPLVSLRVVGRRVSHSFGLPPQEAPVMISMPIGVNMSFLLFLCQPDQQIATKLGDLTKNQKSLLC